MAVPERPTDKRRALRDRILIGSALTVVFGLSLFFAIEIGVSFSAWLWRLL